MNEVSFDNHYVPADSRPQSAAVSDDENSSKIHEMKGTERVGGNVVVEVSDNPKMGVLWYVVYSLKLTAILYITKGIYALNPGIEVLQITAMKALISVLILALALNRNLKHVMYDRVDPAAKGALAFKTAQSTASIFISYTAMKYFSVSTVGVVCSLTPLVACVLAWLILKERLTCWTVSSIFIVLACVLLVIFGATGHAATASGHSYLAVVGLCAQPVLLAGGMIASRKMKNNHPMAQACYTNLLLGIVSLIGIACFPHINFDFIYSFSFLSWVLVTFAGIFTIFENTAKFMAFRYEEAAKLQKLAFLPNVWNFLIDLLVIKATFGAMQLVGFSLLFAFYTFELVTFYLKSDPEEGVDR